MVSLLGDLSSVYVWQSLFQTFNMHGTGASACHFILDGDTSEVSAPSEA